MTYNASVNPIFALSAYESTFYTTHNDTNILFNRTTINYYYYLNIINKKVKEVHRIFSCGIHIDE